MTDNKRVNQEEPQDLTPELIERLRCGDAEAGRLLEKLYRPAIFRCCMGYLGRPDEAEDAVQEVFFKVLTAEQVPRVFRAYLYKVTRNHCLNLLRSRARHQDKGYELPPETVLHETQTGHLTRLLKEEQRDKLARLLVSLSQEQREALRLRYTEGLSRSEVAEVLEVPESVVKSRLFEGLRKLREHSSLVGQP